MGRDFVANSGSEVNISEGSVSFSFHANFDSVVNIDGGAVSAGFNANSGSEVNISGGSFGTSFDAAPGSNVELTGGEFVLNGTAFSGETISLAFGDIFSGTLADGSTFIFSDAASDTLSNVTLTPGALPTLNLSPIIVSTANPNLPSGLRAGQTLTLLDGGELGRNFEMIDATLNVEGGILGPGAGSLRSEINISGGSVSSFFNAELGSVINISGGSVGSIFRAFSGSIVNISGGSLGSNFNAQSGSVVNISGGSIGNGFNAGSGSEVNLFGSDFEIDGVPLDDSLTIEVPLTIDDRDVTLSGLLADGSSFRFELNSVDLFSNVDGFASDATLTVTLVNTFVLGDANQDGVVDFSDIPAFIAVLQAGEFLDQVDIDLNGVVDFADIGPFIDILIGT